MKKKKKTKIGKMAVLEAWVNHRIKKAKKIKTRETENAKKTEKKT